MRILGVLILAATVATGCSRSAPAPNSSPAAQGPRVGTEPVHRGTMPILVTGFGTVSGGANAQASLAFPQPGRIASVDVTVGQQVQTGYTLARLDRGPFEADVAQSEATLASAEATYTKVAAGARPQQLVQTDAQISAARSQRTVAQAKFARQQQLLRLGVAAQADVESAQADAAAAAAALKVLEQQQSIQRAPWAPDLAAAKAAVAQAEAQLSASRLKRESATLRAPFAGIITARLHQNGESVDATTPVVALSQISKVVFTAQFTPNDVQRMHRGDVADVRISGVAVPAHGRVVAINPAQSADGRTVPVLIDVGNSSVAFGPGAYGEASIRIGLWQGVYVPSAAIVADPTTGVVQVFRKSGERFEPVQVHIVSEASGRTWLRAGGLLHAGDVVVSRGAYALLAAPAASAADADSK